MRLVFDTESDGLRDQATQLWCIVAYDLDSGRTHQFTPDIIDAGVKFLQCADQLIAHNCIMHDLPLIQRLYPEFEYDLSNVEDTFILSSLYNPDRVNGHSIDAWGYSIGRKKPVHEDWSQFSMEMLHRCTEDTMINVEVWHLLQQEAGTWDWSQAIDLEYRVARIQAEQEQNGVMFDVLKAKETLSRINKKISEIESKALAELPLRPVVKGVPVNRPFVKSGAYSAMSKQWYPEDTEEQIIGGPFSRIEWTEFNLNSDQQIKNYFLSHGWQPTEWNYKKDGKKLVYSETGDKIRTSPKLTEDSYGTIDGDLPKLIARRNILKHRQGLIFRVNTKGEAKGWLTMVREDQRIAAEAIPLATNTARYRHKQVVNVPKAKEHVVLGKEMRELFCVPEDRVQVGVDAVGLEARCQCHYLLKYEGGEEAVKEIMEGDIHTKNMLAFQQEEPSVNRDISKNIYYALMYGAQPGKVGETAGSSKKVGQKLFDKFWEANPALSQLRDDVIAQYKELGFIIGIDGRKIFIRSPHSALNALFQSTGSIIVKTATSLVWDDLRESDIDAMITIHQHDEWQAEVSNEDTECYIEKCLNAFPRAGKKFNFNVPIEGDAQVGGNWAECH